MRPCWLYTACFNFIYCLQFIRIYFKKNAFFFESIKILPKWILDVKGIYKSVVTSSGFWAQKPENLMAKIASIWHSDAYLRILNIISMNLSTWKKNVFLEFVCFPRFLKPTNYPRKPLNLGGNRIFCQNHQKSTNVDFSDNSIDRSVKYCMKVSSLKYWWKLTSFHDFIIFWS